MCVISTSTKRIKMYHQNLERHSLKIIVRQDYFLKRIIAFGKAGYDSYRWSATICFWMQTSTSELRL